MHTNRLEKLKALNAENPHDTFVLFALGKEMESLGEDAEAIQLFEKLIVIDGSYVGAYYHLGKLWEKKEEIKKALNIYEAGIQVALAAKDAHSLSELRNAKMNLEIE